MNLPVRAFLNLSAAVRVHMFAPFCKGRGVRLTTNDQLPKTNNGAACATPFGTLNFRRRGPRHTDLPTTNAYRITTYFTLPSPMSRLPDDIRSLSPSSLLPRLLRSTLVVWFGPLCMRLRQRRRSRWRRHSRCWAFP